MTSFEIKSFPME